MRYMGSKSRIAKKIVPIIQNYINDNNITTYIEPFCGGCNVVDKIKCENKIASDLNKYLIALLVKVRDDRYGLYDKVTYDLYNEVRKCVRENDSSKYEDWEIGNVGFLASYNGRFVDGGMARNGYERVKDGYRYRDYYQESKRNLLRQADDLQGIDFAVKNYLEYTPDNTQDTVIYCDPPYERVKKYANAPDFDYYKFWEWVRDMSKTNIVIVSEQDAPDDFKCIWEQEVLRSIKPTSKSKAVEKLFVYDK